MENVNKYKNVRNFLNDKIIFSRKELHKYIFDNDLVSKTYILHVGNFNGYKKIDSIMNDTWKLNMPHHRDFLNHLANELDSLHEKLLKISINNGSNIEFSIIKEEFKVIYNFLNIEFEKL